MTKMLALPAVLAALLFVAPPLLANAGIIPQFPAFMAWVGSLVPAVLAIVIGLKLSVGPRRALGRLSIIVGLLPLVTIAYGVATTRGFPPINDIATNLDNPPQFAVAQTAPENAGKDLDYPEVYKEPVRAFYADLISLQLPVAAAEAYRLALAVAEEQPRFVVAKADAEAMTIEGSESTGIFKFTDDYVVRVLQMDGGSQVDMRSRSRVGQADFGANAKRIRRFFTALARAAGQPLPEVSN